MTDDVKAPEDRFDQLLEHRMTRRRLLEQALATTAGVGLATFGGSSGLASGDAAPLQASKMKPADGLAIQVFPTSLQSTQALLQNTYDKQYGVSASVITVPSDYYTVTETRFLSGNPPFDTLDMDPGFMGKYYQNRWVVNLEGLPGVTALKKDMFPAARKACTAPDGKLTALPYYTNIISMFYNERILKAHHLTPAKTWAELYQQGKTLKKAGLASPIIPVWTTKYDLTSYTFIVDCISRGMHLQFDKNLNPLWDKNPIALAVLKYWRTLQDGKLVPADALSIDHHQSSAVMQAGQGAYFWFNSYELANLNKKGTSPEAGHIRAMLMPETHATSTYTAVTYQSKHHARADAWPLTSFMSGYDKNGKQTGPVNVAINEGLLVGYKTALKDPRIKRAWSAWSNKADLQIFSQQLAHSFGEGPVLNTAWYSSYQDNMTQTLSRYLAGELTAKEALKSTADYTRSLKKS